MAQTSSAAREPSMEEILASIRRIIEDSDVSRQPVPAPSVRGEVAEFRRPVTEKPVEQTEKPAMMRNVFQDEPALRGSIDDLSEKMEGPEDEDEVVLNAGNDDRSGMTSASLASSVEQAEEPEAMVEASTSSVDVPQAAETPSISEPEPEAATAMDRVDEQVDSAVLLSEPVVKKQAATHILSQVAERQVAAAFEDLNHAVHSEPRRSFDDIAAELLRPMLHDWLDNNLPPLVERLVREEIERVVRGDR